MSRRPERHSSTLLVTTWVAIHTRRRHLRFPHPRRRDLRIPHPRSSRVDGWANLRLQPRSQHVSSTTASRVPGLAISSLASLVGAPASCLSQTFNGLSKSSVLVGVVGVSRLARCVGEVLGRCLETLYTRVTRAVYHRSTDHADNMQRYR